MGSPNPIPWESQRPLNTGTVSPFSSVELCNALCSPCPTACLALNRAPSILWMATFKCRDNEVVEVAQLPPGVSLLHFLPLHEHKACQKSPLLAAPLNNTPQMSLYSMAELLEGFLIPLWVSWAGFPANGWLAGSDQTQVSPEPCTVHGNQRHPTPFTWDTPKPPMRCQSNESSCYTLELWPRRDHCLLGLLSWASPMDTESNGYRRSNCQVLGKKEASGTKWGT